MSQDLHGVFLLTDLNINRGKNNTKFVIVLEEQKHTQCSEMIHIFQNIELFSLITF